ATALPARPIAPRAPAVRARCRCALGVARLRHPHADALGRGSARPRRTARQGREHLGHGRGARRRASPRHRRALPRDQPGPRVNLLVDLVVRLLLVVPVASISYEALRLGASHERSPLMRLLVAPGLLLQGITTRRPDDRMIEVAVASLEEAIAGDREAEAAA